MSKYSDKVKAREKYARFMAEQTKPKSDCCDAPIKEGEKMSQWHLCTKCKWPCNEKGEKID